jgi:hypothetical protein
MAGSVFRFFNVPKLYHHDLLVKAIMMIFRFDVDYSGYFSLNSFGSTLLAKHTIMIVSTMVVFNDDGSFSTMMVSQQW